ncbi:hypothetical protein GCM10017687_32840 [Streptomyces echinatus]
MLAQYDRDGFIAAPGVFSQAELASIKTALAEDVTVKGPHLITEDDGETMRAVYASHTRHPLFRDLVTSERLLGPAVQLVGRDLYVHQFKINTKRPFGGESWAWHQDYPVWRDADRMPEARAVNVAVFLDDVSEFNGPVVFLRGSHRLGSGTSRRRQGGETAEHIDPRDYTLSGDDLSRLAGVHEMTSPKGAAGTVVFFHPEIVHGSAPNISPYPPRPADHDVQLLVQRPSSAGRAAPRVPRGPGHHAAGAAREAAGDHGRHHDGSGCVTSGRLAAAAVLEEFGKPVTIRDLPVPEPEQGEILVDVTYGGICGTDLHLQQGHLPIPTPLTLGHEGLGTVRTLGSGAVRDALGTELRPGDTVMWASSIACGRCVPCRQHREPTLCEARRTYGVNRPLTEGSGLAGAWAEAILLHPGAVVVKLGEGVDELAAMSLACAGPTLVHALYERRPVRVGETVIVQGSGPVGLAAAALAQLAGAEKVILIGGPRPRLDLAAKCGIGDHHIDIVTGADPERALDEARALTPSGAGADLVIECAGVPAAVAQGLTLARRGGSYLVVGQYTDSGDTLLNPHQIVHRQLDIRGSWAFSGAHLVEYVRLLPALCGRFDLRSLVVPFPLADVREAMEAVADGTVVKAVLQTS